MLLLCLNPTLNGMTIDATGHASFTAKGSRAQKMKISIKDFLSECDQISSFQQIWSHLLKKSLMENFISCAVCSGEWDEFRGYVW